MQHQLSARMCAATKQTIISSLKSKTTTMHHNRASSQAVLAPSLSSIRPGKRGVSVAPLSQQSLRSQRRTFSNQSGSSIPPRDSPPGSAGFLNLPPPRPWRTEPRPAPASAPFHLVAEHNLRVRRRNAALFVVLFTFVSVVYYKGMTMTKNSADTLLGGDMKSIEAELDQEDRQKAQQA